MILVIAEQRDGTLNRASWEAIAAAQQLAAGAPVVVGVAGGDVAGSSGRAVGRGRHRSASRVTSPPLAAYTADGWVHAHAAFVAEVQADLGGAAAHLPDARLRPGAGRRRSTARSSPTAPRSSGSREQVVFSRPMYQGKLAADVRVLGDAPWLVTMQIGAFRADAGRARGVAGAGADARGCRSTRRRFVRQPEPPFQEAKQAVDLSQAERIVSVGRGIKGPEHLPLAEALAAALGAELAASRPICDAGWLPMERQIGSSGQTVAPKLYVAVGISGAIQHVVGMKGARTIVAINKDADAPIFEVADYGYAGDLFEFLPALTAELKKVSVGRSACGSRSRAGLWSERLSKSTC